MQENKRKEDEDFSYFQLFLELDVHCVLSLSLTHRKNINKFQILNESIIYILLLAGWLSTSSSMFGDIWFLFPATSVVSWLNLSQMMCMDIFQSIMFCIAI